MPTQEEQLAQAVRDRDSKAIFRVKWRLDYVNFHIKEDIPMLTNVRVKLPEVEGGEYLFVIKGKYNGRQVVAFHNATDLVTGFDGALSKWEQNKLRWRDDNWALPSEGSPS